jgi:hypothetical protein
MGKSPIFASKSNIMAENNAQHYGNHRQWVPGYHFILLFLITVVFIGSLVNLYKSFGDHERLYSASLISVISIILLLVFWYMRAFAAKAQDRAIRAEENLRHFVLTGKLMPANLRPSQIVALRFSPDDEFLALTDKAAKEGLSNDAIKKEIKNWRGDHHRV